MAKVLRLKACFGTVLVAGGGDDRKLKRNLHNHALSLLRELNAIVIFVHVSDEATRSVFLLNFCTLFLLSELEDLHVFVHVT